MRWILLKSTVLSIDFTMAFDYYRFEMLEDWRPMLILKLVLLLIRLVINVVLILLLPYSLWHGFKLETGNVVIEGYGIKRFFK